MDASFDGFKESTVFIKRFGAVIILMSVGICLLSSHFTSNVEYQHRIWNMFGVGMSSNKQVPRSLQGTAIWGETHGILLESKNIPYDCTYNNNRMCCSALRPRPSAQEKLETKVASTARNVKGRNICVIVKLYVSSPYEIRHIEKAKVLSAMKSEVERRKALVDFITSQEEIDAANIWLNRVKVRMSSNRSSDTVTQDDEMYLSRFLITKTCPSIKGVPLEFSWSEWIEPLSVFGRHPYALSNCGNDDVNEKLLQRQNYPGPTQLMNVDYILTQSANSFFNNTTPHMGQRYKGHMVKQFLLDAGSHSFESSLIWLTCAYSQRQMDLDSIHGWEATLLEPKKFWSEVPPPYYSRYHFYNAPISKNSNENSSPLKVIKDLATIDDFVALKLDIDRPMIEIPIATQILTDPKITELIDEFFFELHFQCDLIQGCWNPKPDEMAGQKLDRHSVMLFFLRYRNAGIRSHFWP